MNPLVLATCGKFLGHATSFQLHLTQVIAIGPGEPAQTIHRDQWAFDFFPFPQGYEVQCNTIWAMTDFTEENGATRVVPGSNKLGDKLKFKLEDSESAAMTKGSVLVYSAVSIMRAAPTNPTQCAPASTSLTTCRGCGRKKINTWPCHSKSRARCRSIC